MARKRPNAAELIIGANLRRIRLAQGFSQQELGNECGITFQQIQKYEKGMNGMRGSRIVQMCGVLKCSLADLFAGTMSK